MEKTKIIAAWRSNHVTIEEIIDLGERNGKKSIEECIAYYFTEAGQTQSEIEAEMKANRQHRHRIRLKIRKFIASGSDDAVLLSTYAEERCKAEEEWVELRNRKLAADAVRNDIVLLWEMLE